MPQVLSTMSGELDQSLVTAVQVLRAGGLVAFPTETVYGLGADARQEQAVRKIFAAKHRPATHPVIVHLPSAEQLDEWSVDVSDAARRVAAACWPGPVTMVLRAANHVSPIVTGGSNTVGLRVPGHSVALVLLRQFGGAIAAPSANRFTRVSPTTAAHVVEDLGEAVDVVLDAGSTPVGIESTIVDFAQNPPVLLRTGAISAEQLTDVAGVFITMANVGQTASPGQHPVHYSPATKVVACRAERLADCVDYYRRQKERLVVLAWQSELERYSNVVWWQWPSDLEQVGRDLYARLRLIDSQLFDLAIVELPATTGLGAALADRLRRAAGSTEFEG